MDSSEARQIRRTDMITSTNEHTYHFRGLSSNKKPALDKTCNGSSFLEMDTGKMFIFDGEDLKWVLQKDQGGGGGGGETYYAGEGIVISESNDISIDKSVVAMKTEIHNVTKSSINGNIKVDSKEMNVYTLPEAYKNYLDEVTYKKPTLDTLTILSGTSTVSGTYETGTSINVTAIKHKESNIDNIVSLSFGSQSLTPVSALTTIQLDSPITLKNSTTFKLTGTDTKGTALSKSTTITFSDYAYSALTDSEDCPSQGTKESVASTFKSSGKEFSYKEGEYLYLYSKNASKVETSVLGQ